jgi:hypothetical protein
VPLLRPQMHVARRMRQRQPRLKAVGREAVGRIAAAEVTAGGPSAPISWWDGVNRQVAPGRPHGGGRILTTCTFLRLRGRFVRSL